MNFKKFISGVSAFAIAASAFAGMAVTANAEVGTVTASQFVAVNGADADTSITTVPATIGQIKISGGKLMADGNQTYAIAKFDVSDYADYTIGSASISFDVKAGGYNTPIAVGTVNDISADWVASNINYNNLNGVYSASNIQNNTWSTKNTTVTITYNVTNSIKSAISNNNGIVTFYIATKNAREQSLETVPSLSIDYSVEEKAVAGAVTVSYTDGTTVFGTNTPSVTGLWAGDDVSYTFPKYVTDANNNVLAYSDATSFKGTATTAAEASTVNVDYTAYDGVAIAVEPTSNTMVSDADKFSNCNSYRAFNKNNIASITIPEDGEYQISANIFSNNVKDDRYFYAKVGETELMNTTINWSINGVKVVTSDKAMLKQGDVINFTCGDTNVAVDYILVEKTGDYVAPAANFNVDMGNGTLAEGDNNDVATWYIATVTNDGNAEGSFDTMTLYKNGTASAPQSFTKLTLDPSGEVNIGVIVNGLNTTADTITATVE